MYSYFTVLIVFWFTFCYTIKTLKALHFDFNIFEKVIILCIQKKIIKLVKLSSLLKQSFL